MSQPGEPFRKGSVDLPDFKMALFRHVDRTGMLFAMTVTDQNRPGDQQRYINLSRVSSVEFLEAMLKPYWDDDYKSWKDSVKSDDKLKNDDYKYAREMFGQLVQLLGRKKFLPEEPVHDALEDDPGRGWEELPDAA